MTDNDIEQQLTHGINEIADKLKVPQSDFGAVRNKVMFEGDLGQPVESESRGRRIVTVLAVAASIAIVAAVVGLAIDKSVTEVVVADSTATSTSFPWPTTANPSALAFGSPEVSGEPLSPYENLGDPDPAIGTIAPIIDGQDFDGSSVSIAGDGTYRLVAAMAHWSPHCAVMMPRINNLFGFDLLDPRIQPLVVATGSDNTLPNFPPADWLSSLDYSGQTLVDDSEATAMAALGGSAYPYYVLLDGSNKVLWRGSGEMSELDMVNAIGLAMANEPNAPTSTPDDPTVTTIAPTSTTVAPTTTRADTGTKMPVSTPDGNFLAEVGLSLPGNFPTSVILHFPDQEYIGSAESGPDLAIALLGGTTTDARNQFRSVITSTYYTATEITQSGEGESFFGTARLVDKFDPPMRYSVTSFVHQGTPYSLLVIHTPRGS